MENQTTSASTTKSKLYTIEGVLQGDVEIRTAKTQGGEKPYAYGKITGKNGKTHTIVTYVGKGIAFLTGRKDGEAVRVYGTFEQQDKGRTFSVMGESIKREKPAAEETPAAEATAEVAEVPEAEMADTVGDGPTEPAGAELAETVEA